MAIMKDRAVGARGTNTSVRAMAASSITIHVVKKYGFELVFPHAWLALLHDLDVGSRTNLEIAI